MSTSTAHAASQRGTVVPIVSRERGRRNISCVASMPLFLCHGLWIRRRISPTPRLLQCFLGTVTLKIGHVIRTEFDCVSKTRCSLRRHIIHRRMQCVTLLRLASRITSMDEEGGQLGVPLFDKRYGNITFQRCKHEMRVVYVVGSN